MIEVIKHDVWRPEEAKYLWRAYSDGKLVAENYNVVTNRGRQQSVGLWFGAVTTPQWMGLDTASGVIVSVTTTSVTVSGYASGAIVGDTLILSLGSALNQETTSAVTSVTPSGGNTTYAWTTPTTKTHVAGEFVVRTPLASDVGLTTETTYNATYAPTGRKAIASQSYGSGVATGQWYFNGAEGVLNIMGLGLFDNATIGSGIMWNRVAMNINHTAQAELILSVQVSYQ